MRQSVQKRQDSINLTSKPTVSGAVTTELRSKPLINHPYTKEDSSGSQRGQQLIQRQTYVRDSQYGRRTSEIGSSKRLTSYAQKRKTLHRYKYINPLARLDYEDKMTQIYTKYTKMSKQSVMKKIKAKNRIAQFQQQEQEVQEGFEELMEFKYGKDKTQKIYFEKEEILQYQFCQYCDVAHNDHPQVHSVLCQKKRKEQPQLYSPFSQKYTAQSLYRIKLVVQKIKSPEFEMLNQILLELQKLVDPSRSKLAREKQKIVKDIQDLKLLYCNDIIFVKIIAKVSHLVKQL